MVGLTYPVLAQDPAAEEEAPAAGETMASEETTTSGRLNTVNIWGGWNVSMGESIDDINDAVDACNAVSGSSCESSAGGISFGADFYHELSPGFQLGLGISSIKVLDSTIDYSVSSGGTSISLETETSTSYIPLLIQGRYFLVDGFYLGAGAGFAFAQASYTVNGVEGEASSNNELAVGASLGYQIAIDDKMGLDVHARWNMLLSDSGVQMITPGLAYYFKF